MSDLQATSYGKDYCDKGGSGNSLLFLILLLCLCGGNDGFFGACGDSKSCGIGCGFDGILPLILILCLCGGF